LEVTRAAHLDAITIHRNAPTVWHCKPSWPAQSESSFKSEILRRDHCGVRIAGRGSIERWTGKAKHVIDMRVCQARDRRRLAHFVANAVGSRRRRRTLFHACI